MEAFVYILFSKTLNRYYIGSAELEPNERLKLYLSKNHGNRKFTGYFGDADCCFSDTDTPLAENGSKNR